MSIIVLLIAAVSVFGGLVMLGLGGYALYESFSGDEGERIWLGSPTTARIIGVVALLAGLSLLCLPAAVFIFGVGFMPVF
ncbi:MAG: hypothetical protein ACLFU8_08945 [Anaerolineales bacterium]